ncbi:PREDICTED: voltage-dependent calcium channel subunit alpha-2/delta-4-like [Buceros rhinoceros silvestris]|uniref:voltage-dependent calcium channel subunit alpha-2/delta-4-like n=1 Tax=Buceros rhinoceros silvestris TaxID=175836 RepID=UPI000528A728|nr:PREDICTED: voltage-dependent calcium channel subunit alpha-2/delta-4-like [Buceros rhinoceros silvestris]
MPELRGSRRGEKMPERGGPKNWGFLGESSLWEQHMDNQREKPGKADRQRDKQRMRSPECLEFLTVLARNCQSTPTAVGVQIKLELLQRKFWMAMQQILNCFLIDNNGFILISKRPAETGKFFGAVDGSVMSQLLNMGMFRRVTMYDYQAMCKVPYHHHSGARPLLSPIYAFLAAVKWLISDFLIFLLEFNMSSFWHSDNLADAKAVFHHSHKHKKHDTLQPCDTEYPVFVYEPTIKETNGLIECGDCQKMFVAQQIASSNLLLLVIDAACDCSVFPPVLRNAKEVKYNASVKCERMRSQKLRRRPDSCHAFHPEENAQDCGGTAEVSVSPTLLLLPLALLLQ